MSDTGPGRDGRPRPPRPSSASSSTRSRPSNFARRRSGSRAPPRANYPREGDSNAPFAPGRTAARPDVRLAVLASLRVTARRREVAELLRLSLGGGNHLLGLRVLLFVHPDCAGCCLAGAADGRGVVNLHVPAMPVATRDNRGLVFFLRDLRLVLHFDQLPDRYRLGGERLRSEEHTSELQSPKDLVCRLLL